MNDPGAPASGRGRLIESLWQDARREADQCVTKAEAEAEKLLEDNASFREHEVALSSEKARQEADPHVARILNQARGRARQLLLEGRYSFLDSCFDEALRLATGNDGFREEVRSSFPHLLTQALSVLGNREDMEISVNPADVANARSILDETGTSFNLVADESTCGGVMIRTNGGSIVADSTLEARLSALRKAPPIDLLKMINPGEDR